MEDECVNLENERIDYLYKYFEIKKGTEHSQIDLILEMATQFDFRDLQPLRRSPHMS
jgi:hypothetical protein